MGQKRAKVGGEVGLNGEFYHGGEFLPNTELASQHKEKVKGTGAKKQQVEPYTWVVAPIEGQRAIYGYIAGVFGKLVNGQMIITCSDQTVEYFKTNRFMLALLADRYNKGERWF